MKFFIQSAMTFILAAVFLYAGISKVIACSAFYQDIRQFQILPDEMAWWLAHYLPPLEIVVGSAMMWKETRGAASLLSCILLIIFTGAIISAWLRDLNVECGCFGSIGKSHYPWIVLRDVTLLFMSAYVLKCICGRMFRTGKEPELCSRSPRRSRALF
jgi:putative oxidoreductase